MGDDLTPNLPTDEEGWHALRAIFDEAGHEALEAVVAQGTPAEVAGQRITHFNDMLIEQLKQRADEARRTRPDSGTGA